MADYISREAAIEKITALINESGRYTAYESGADDACFILEHEIPAADVRPVVHGKWNVVEKPLEKATICECSECKHRIWMYDGDDGWNYCPHCGADMREEG